MAAALLAGTVGLAAGTGGAEDTTIANLLRDGRAALARGDGVAAEIALRKALAQGAPRPVVAARMGEALLDQGNLRGARDWLGPGLFGPGEAAHGWRMLGRLELAEGNLPAAGQAFDAALKLAPQDSLLWVDIARLRYQGSEQVQTIAAADTAVRLGPANPRALEMRGLLVRDSFGPAAALAWFGRGLQQAPDDVSLLGEYAASLGELGRTREALTVTRRMVAVDPHNARAFLLQAVLAARAGDAGLVRTLLSRAGASALATPAGLLLSGIAELETGNSHQAVEQFDRLLRRQPDNRRARLLLARALAAAGNDAELLARFGDEGARPEASPYLLTLLGRALENRGQRDLAAPLLDRAARAGRATVAVLPARGAGPADRLRDLLAAEQVGVARQMADGLRSAAPGSFDAILAQGDTAFAAQDWASASSLYRQAATVRMTQALLQRLVAVELRDGRPTDARLLLAGYRAGRPRDPLGLRLEAGVAAAGGDWSRAAAVLTFLAQGPGCRDARLWSDLAFARDRKGDQAGAAQAGLQAYALQRSAPTATRAMALAPYGDKASAAEMASGFWAKAQLLEGS